MEVTASDSGRRIKTRKTEIGKGEELVDLKQIEYILKIAEMKNVSQASKELFISQSALNQQLLKLEKELGAPLFSGPEQLGADSDRGAVCKRSQGDPADKEKYI